MPSVGSWTSAARTGREMSSPTQIVRAVRAVRRRTGTASSSSSVAGSAESQSSPASAPRTMAATWLAADGSSRTTASAATAIVARRGPAASVRAIPITAWATTATAAALRPSNHPSSPVTPMARAPRAKPSMSRAEGRVKPTHAAAIPR